MDETACRVVFAHPSNVAQADQLAAEEGIEWVELRESCSEDWLYLVDLDAAMRFDESFLDG